MAEPRIGYRVSCKHSSDSRSEMEMFMPCLPWSTAVSSHLHTHQHRGVHMHVCRSTEPPAKIPLTFTGTLWMPLHFSSDKGWASIMGVTVQALGQISGWPSSIAKVTAGGLSCPTQGNSATAPCGPRELQGPHSVPLLMGLQDDWH